MGCTYKERLALIEDWKQVTPSKLEATTIVRNILAGKCMSVRPCPTYRAQLRMIKHLISISIATFRAKIAPLICQLVYRGPVFCSVF